MKRIVAYSLFLCLLALAPKQAAAQGEQTGALGGRVTTVEDSLPLPGASVTASSPSLQGLRTATTDVNGVYLRRGLRPGEYQVVFEVPDLAHVERMIRSDSGG